MGPGPWAAGCDPTPPVRAARPFPTAIAGLTVPQDDVAAGTWAWAGRSLPDFLFTHSVRSYCWAAAIAYREGWSFDRTILWVASLLHDVALRRVSRNRACFETEGAEFARRFARRLGMSSAGCDAVARAIVLHMAPGVTLDDGVESVLLDRATGLDVRGSGYETIVDLRDAVLRDYPRRAFDRHFAEAIRRDAIARPGCQSARLLGEMDLVGAMARSPWADRR